MRLNGRKTPSSHLWGNIRDAWSVFPAVQNTSVRECRRAGPFTRNSKDHTSTIGNREQIHRNSEASESSPPSRLAVLESGEIVLGE